MNCHLLSHKKFILIFSNKKIISYPKVIMSNVRIATDVHTKFLKSFAFKNDNNYRMIRFIILTERDKHNQIVIILN